MYTSGGLLPVPLQQFQVASCGSNHAERSDLDYCNMRDGVLTQEIEEQILSDANGGNTRLVDTNINGVSSNYVSSSSNANDQSTPTLSTPAPVAPPSQAGLIALDPCIGPSGVCAIVDFRLPVTPADLPIADTLPPPIDDLAPAIDVLAPTIDVLAPAAPPPTQVTFLNNPEPGSDLPPLFTPQPLKPIPEASTWVMTATGFSVLAFFFRKKRRPRINPISVIDVSDLNKP